MTYDRNNVFARILRGEIPCKKVYEDEHVLAFDDFSAKASDAEIGALIRALGSIARQRGVGESGYRILANTGRDGHQEVPHFHVHLVGGRDLGAMLPRR